MIDFELTSNEPYSDSFRNKGINSFKEACDYIAQLPYGRNANREDFSLVLSEAKGTCSSKHALLSELALENSHPEIELIAGIFLMNEETHSKLTGFFEDKPYSNIPECHCYLRYNGERFDYTDTSNGLERIIPRLVREQRIDPNQVSDWKVMIHKHYLEGWLSRNPAFQLTLDDIWKDREEAIALLSK
ncbi:hypothetical protein [Fluviicola taffensis]|uniref:Uncharacterized protein n=1 Tax=Fluviicola taffensis (strain DSM 16823 / NCIMB 13979 / RW262) TaxID=755732 RepID=F2IIE7_FLUTR|nr:hypothetical protein [Fluviicola taffensis]AEA44873.1 hypothetical protein Fluta_2894 [Fluviicola taffensis DSM 16823]